MPDFNRRFDVDALASWDAAHPGSAVRALFDRWAPPGTADPARPLRVGLRGGYLNLYVKGQSVAKLSIGRAGLAVGVHRSYVEGRLPGDKAGQRYVKFDGPTLADPAIAALVPGWITAAERHAGAEKRFVDALIAANPGAVDLEMALPASDKPGAERVAPRMDLVVAQDGAIAFWEAKCANNGELRARGEAQPPVLEQLATYGRWMTSTRVAEVAAAYRRAASALLGLHALFRPGETPACVPNWRALAAADPTVIARPGIVIGNYRPDGSPERIASDRMAQAARSFAGNGHRAKLEAAGATVREVALGGDHALPALA